MLSRLVLPIHRQVRDSTYSLARRSFFQARAMSTSHIFVVWAPDDEAPGTFEKRMSVREEHAARAKADPSVRLAGPMLSPESVTGGEKKLIGSMFLIEAQKIEEVREKIETDVYWRTGVWDKAKVTILPYLPALGTTKVV